MRVQKKKAKRDVEKAYAVKQFAAKLRRLSDCVENGKSFRIQVAGQRVSIPSDARVSVEHERGTSEEVVELQFTWPVK